MRGTIIQIAVDGRQTVQELHERATLDVLKAAIGGGYIEVVPAFHRYKGHDCVAFCDEEGKLKQMPINRAATWAWSHAYPPLLQDGRFTDVLVGTIAIVFGDKEFMETL